MDSAVLNYDVKNGVAYATLNRPARMNALNAALSDALMNAVKLASSDEDVRVLVVRAAGERAFCSGLDLDARADETPMDPARVRERTLHPERSLHGVLLGCEKPVIAAVNGIAVGGGLGIALCADIVVASDAARFGTAHVKLGLPLLDILGHLLPHRVGPGRTADMAFTGRLVDAKEALAIGLADRVISPMDLEEQVCSLAEEIARQAPVSLYYSKQAIRRSYSETYLQYMQYERYIFGASYYSEDAKEAVRARREKRPPVYRGV